MAIEIAYITPGNATLVTETLQTWDETERVIDSLRLVLHDAYMGELVENQGLVEASVLDRCFDPDNILLRDSFVSTTLDIHGRGSRITVFKEPAVSEIVGFAKLGPAPAMTENDHDGYDYEGYYLNNIAVRPGSLGQYWCRGFGSMLLHANFTAQQCDPNLPVVLDAINGNDRVNDWYRRLGFVPDPEVKTGTLNLDETKIPETYFVTPDDVLLGGVLNRLETKRPWLQSAQRVI